MSFWGYKPYVPVAQRRANAAKEVAKLEKRGRVVSPVVVEGTKIAASFWGKAWCDNLERYSDFANRLPRGRTYVRNGSVVDLQLARGRIEALVSGSDLYKVTIDITVAAPARWQAICAACAGSVGSIVELLQGRLSKHVMERVCRKDDGLFPAPREIGMSCSCPDWAGMCKHVAATLYGVGARLDRDPDLLFTLRGVDRSELISAGADVSIADAGARSDRVLEGDDVAALFGLEFDAAPLAERKSHEAGAVAAKAAPAPSCITAAGITAEEIASKPVGVKRSRRRRSDGKPASQTLVANAEKASKARTSRKGRQPASSTLGSTGAGAQARSENVAEDPVIAKSSRTPRGTVKPKLAEPREGRTRVTKWIGASARKAARK